MALIFVIIDLLSSHQYEMSEKADILIQDRVYLSFATAAVLLSAITYYLFSQFFVKSNGSWLAPLFTPIHFYAIIVFAINIVLSLLSYKSDRFLSLAFNFSTIAVDSLLVIALVLNINNPNG